VPRWHVGPVRLVVDAWLGWVAPPRRAAYRLQGGLAFERSSGTELSLVGYGANDNWMIGHGEIGMTASLAYRFPQPKS
jgi:DMSO/TMAO reductase YedYZ molybdopterin-dependent catalytic subunit